LFFIRWQMFSAVKTAEKSQVTVAHASNASYLGGWDGRIMVWGQPRQIVHETPYLQNNQTKMDWRHGSSSLAGMKPWVQTQSHQKKKKKKTACMILRMLFEVSQLPEIILQSSAFVLPSSDNGHK
jgi:hypothetical protein